jgi:hypothetical protein
LLDGAPVKYVVIGRAPVIRLLVDITSKSEE